tara:strand:- start:429 stop:698 length:270 start_codon:yes stop_codon:yes gene_type:complete
VLQIAMRATLDAQHEQGVTLVSLRDELRVAAIETADARAEAAGAALALETARHALVKNGRLERRKRARRISDPSERPCAGPQADSSPRV